SRESRMISTNTIIPLCNSVSSVLPAGLCGEESTISQSPPQPIRIHRHHPQLLRKPVVYISAHDSPNAGDELEEFGEVDVVAVFLLKIPPVELVDIVRECPADAIPVFNDRKDFPSTSLTGEGELKDVQDVNPFAIVFGVDAVARRNLEEHLHLKAEP